MRYSLDNPHAYVDANLVGFLNILEGCRHGGMRHLLYASSSVGLRRQHAGAVLGARQCRSSGQPLRRDQEGQRTDGPHLQPSLRPADHGPAFLHRLRPVGPARHGDVHLHQRDPRRQSRSTCSTTARCGATSPTSTTSSKAMVRLIDRAAAGDPEWNGDAGSSSSPAPWRLYNIGNNRSDELPRWSTCSSRSSAARPSSISSRCSRAMCRKPTPIPTISPPRSASVRDLDRGRHSAVHAKWYRDFYHPDTDVSPGSLSFDFVFTMEHLPAAGETALAAAVPGSAPVARAQTRRLAAARR